MKFEPKVYGIIDTNKYQLVSVKKKTPQNEEVINGYN